MIKINPEDPRCWATRDQLQYMVLKSESHIDRIRKRLGNAHEKEGRPILFFLPEWLPAYFGMESQLDVSEDNDLEPYAGTSPWLEEYRKQRARREKLKYEQEAGQMMPIDDADRIFESVATPIREALHRLCDECRPTMDTALDDAERELDNGLAPATTGVLNDH